MDKANILQSIQDAIYETTYRPDIPFSQGVDTEHGTHYKLSTALAEAVYDSAWMFTHGWQKIFEQNAEEDLKELRENVSSMLFMLTGFNNIDGDFGKQSLIDNIMEKLTGDASNGK